MLENRQQANNRVGRDARRLESDRVGIEKRSQVVGSSPDLVGEVVERRVLPDRAREKSADGDVVVLLAQRSRGTISPLKLRRVEIEAHRACDEIGAGPSANLELRAAEAAARNVVGRGHERGRHVGVPREIRSPKIQSVERRLVLVGREAEHGEAGRIAILSRNQRDPGQRCGHRRDVALLIGGHRAVVDGSLAAADIGSGVVALRPIALPHDLHGFQLSRGAQQLRVGDEDLLVSGALHLESARGVTDRGDLHEVIALSARKRDGIATVLVGAGAAIDVAGERGRCDFRVLEWFSLGAEHLASDHVQLLRARWERYCSCYDRGN